MITAAQAQAFTQGHWQQAPSQPQRPLRGVAHDTRKLQNESTPAQIFFAFSSPQGDHHLQQLQHSAVELLVIDRAVHLPAFKGAILQTADTYKALADMARQLLQCYQLSVVAITGSYGKTTSKEMIAQAVAQAGPILKTPASFNNEIGVPLSLLELDGTQRVAILEFSARQAGDIKFLCQIAPPTVAVLLNVGHAHVGVFGSLEAIYQSKAEIFAGLKAGGVALWGSHDAKLGELARTLCPLGTRIESFGIAQGDYLARDVTYSQQGHQQFMAVHQQTSLSLKAGIAGTFGAIPMLAAWGVCRALKLPDQYLQRLNNWQPCEFGRMQLSKSQKNATLLDDTYNASPETIIALAQSLALRSEARKVLVLGPLSELEKGLNTSIKLLAQKLPCSLDAYLVYDPENSGLGTGIKKLAPQLKISTYSTQSELMEALKAWDAPDTVLGLKGSRAAHMERFVLALSGNRVTCQRTNCSWLRRCLVCPYLASPTSNSV